MSRLVAFLLKRPVLSSMVMLVSAALSGMIGSTVPLELAPQPGAQRLTASVVWPHASPETIEERVVSKVEQEGATLRQARGVASVSRTGSGSVHVDLEVGSDAESARYTLQDRLQNLELPPGAHVNVRPADPFATAGFADAPVMRMLARFGGGSEVPAILRLTSRDGPSLQEIASTRLRNAFLTLPGVAEVTLAGPRRDSIRVETRPTELESLGISPNDIERSLSPYARGRRQLGRVLDEGRSAPIYLVPRGTSTHEIQMITVTGAAGVAVQLNEVADVSRALEPPTDRARVDGRPAVILQIRKKQAANLIAFSRAVRATAAEMEVLIDEDITIEVLADEGAEVERLLGDMALRLSGSLAAVLAALMLFFRRWQPSILVFTALGLTLAATVAVMAILDIALSMVTVAAVILASGMLVDNSLVVFEHICGAIDVETVADRAARVLVVVLSASLTNVVVFVPVLFLTGPLATLLLPFAATMLIAMASSVVMTILAVPLLYYYLVRPNAGRAGAVRMKRRLNLLPWLRVRRIAVPVLVVATAWLLLALLPGVWATGNFGDASESNSVVVSVRMLEDAQLDETDEIAGRFEDLAFSEIHRAGTTASLQVVTDVHRTRAGVRVLPKRSNEGSLALSAADRATLSAIQTAWTRQMGNYISVDFVLSGPDGRVSGGGGARGVTRFGPADIEFRGYDYQMLKQHVIDFSRHMERIPYLYALDNGFEREERILFGPSFPGFDLYLNQSAMAAAGASTADVLRAVRRFDLSERMAAVFLSGDSGPQRVPVHMLPQGESGFFRMSEILDVRVGPRASLGDIAELHPLDSAMSIERENQQYVHGINYRVRRMQARAVRQTLEGLIDSYELPPGFSIEMRGGWAGGAEATQRTSLGLVALAAAGLVFMVLAGHFESFRRPLLVFATLPLAVVTVVAAYAIVGQGFGLGALLGLILLAGMAVNDAILFLAELGRVERPLAYPLRDDQRPAVAGPAQRLPDDAESTDKHTGTRLGQVREAARGQRLLRLIPTILCAPTNRSAITASIAIRHRIRPILVTSFTTVAALGSSLFVSGAENDLLSVWREFAIVVVLGIVASTAATIFVVPAICALGNTCSSSVAVVAPRSRK